jgi:uncharacterized protein GlcG (DUF336 family)
MRERLKAPRAWKSGTYCYGAGLTLEAALKMLEAGEKEANQQGVPMAMAISDSGGNLLAFHRMDHTALLSSQISMDKAYTAVYSKQATAKLGHLYRSGELVPLFFHERWITFPGGFPIIKEGVIVGGLGVSGGKIEDCYVARAILRAGGFETSAADEFLEGYEDETQKAPARKGRPASKTSSKKKP